MRYRRLDAQTADYTFGRGQDDFWRDAPEGVAQHILTRLMMWTGQWFADLADGTPWQTQVLGERTRDTRDITVRSRVNSTPHVIEITAYASHTDVDLREWQAAMIVNTEYGAVALRANRLPGKAPPLVPPLEPGAAQASELGILGGTPVTMTPANLTKTGRSDITDFIIQRVDAGGF